MNMIAFGLVAASIFMHSLWHFLCKSSGKPSMAFFALFSTSLFGTMLPFALSSGVLPDLTWGVMKFAVAGALSGAIGNVGLVFAYKYCDISLAYPMARALPVSALLGYLILKEKISAVRWLGLALIMAGLVLSVFFRSGLIIKGISIYSRIN